MNTNRTRHPRQIKVGCNLFNKLGSYMNIMQLQISPRKNRHRNTWVIRMRVLRKVYCKQFCFMRSRGQHFRSLKYGKFSRFNIVENTIRNSPKLTGAKFLGSDKLCCFNLVTGFLLISVGPLISAAPLIFSSEWALPSIKRCNSKCLEI